MDGIPLWFMYSFQCTTCGESWEDEYEIRRTYDSHGLIQVSSFLRGKRTASPLTQGVCRFCGDPAIRLLHRRRINPVLPRSGD